VEWSDRCHARPRPRRQRVRRAARRRSLILVGLEVGAVARSAVRTGTQGRPGGRPLR
jgi:hypothetical protein